MLVTDSAGVLMFTLLAQMIPKVYRNKAKYPRL